MGTHKQIKETQMNTQTTNLGSIHTKNTLGPTGLCELVLVAVHMANFQCTMYKLNARDDFNCSPLLFS